MKLLLDTNIVLDFCNNRRVPFHSECVELLSVCLGRSDIELMVAISSLNDAYYALRRHYGTESQARQDIGRLLNLFEIRPLLVRHARQSYQSDEPDFEDGLIRAVAEDNQADVIVTRDAAAFRNSSVPSMDALECLKLLRGAGVIASESRPTG